MGRALRPRPQDECLIGRNQISTKRQRETSYPCGMQIYFSLLVALIGVLMYALSKNGEVKEIGRIMFGCGLLAFLLTGIEHVLSVIPR